MAIAYIICMYKLLQSLCNVQQTWSVNTRHVCTYSTHCYIANVTLHISVVLNTCNNIM